MNIAKIFPAFKNYISYYDFGNIIMIKLALKARSTHLNPKIESQIQS